MTDVDRVRELLRQTQADAIEAARIAAEAARPTPPPGLPVPDTTALVAAMHRENRTSPPAGGPVCHRDPGGFWLPGQPTPTHTSESILAQMQRAIGSKSSRADL